MKSESKAALVEKTKIVAEKGKKKAKGPYQLLTPGSIRPQGWIRQYMHVIADGWTLYFAKKHEPWLHSVLWNRFKTPFPFAVEDQEAPDYCAYFTDGFLRLAYIIPESDLRKEFDPWLEKVMESQDADGYLGALDPPARWNNWLEIFHQTLIIEALIYNYEITGNKRYLEVAMKAARQPLDHWDTCGTMQGALYGGHGSCMIRPMLKMYSISGNKEYLEFAKKIMEKYGRQNHYLNGGGCAMSHNVCESEHVGLPAYIYEYTGDKKFLEASMLAWERMQPLLAVDGQPHGNEHTFPRRPRGNEEHCGSVEWSITNEHLMRITGDVKFADAAERCVFNAYPSAKSYDSMTLAYMHSPNQFLATDWSGIQFDDPDFCDSKQYYSTGHSPLCCNVISHRAMPYFNDHMVMAAEDGLAIMFYGPNTASAPVEGAGLVELVQDTEYPFEDDVKITVTPEKDAKFALHLRIPGWCSSAAIEINGEKAKAKVVPGKFAVINRKWKKGDVIQLHMEVPIRLEKYPEQYVREGGATVIRGPLTFALRIPEEWKKFKSVHNAPLSETISYYVLPKKDAKFNYALIVDQDNPTDSFEFVKLNPKVSKYPWEHAKVGLKVKARQVTSWIQEGNEEHNMTPGMPFKPMKLAKKVETIKPLHWPFS